MNYDHLFDKYEEHEHEWNAQLMICNLCGMTAEEYSLGRDRPANWDDVDAAYIDGRNVGVEIGKLQYKFKRRRKLIEVGYYLALRRMTNSLQK